MFKTTASFLPHDAILSRSIQPFSRKKVTEQIYFRNEDKGDATARGRKFNIYIILQNFDVLIKLLMSSGFENVYRIFNHFDIRSKIFNIINNVKLKAINNLIFF